LITATSRSNQTGKYVGQLKVKSVISASTFTYHCCNLSGAVAFNVWFTTNGMCVKNNTIVYVARTSNSKRDCEHDLCCCFLPQCETSCTCRSGFPIATVLKPQQ